MKINTTNGVFFTSDTHYMHNNLCRGVTRWRIKDGDGNMVVPFNDVRDFDTLEEMNELMIQNINDTVGENDILFHCGDWSFGGFERVEEFRKLIRCKNIHLLLGNHDHHIQNNKDGIRRFFSSINHYLELRVNDHNDWKYFDKSRDSLFDFIRSGRVVDEYGNEIAPDDFIKMALEWYPEGMTNVKYYNEQLSKGKRLPSPERYEDIVVEGLRFINDTNFSYGKIERNFEVVLTGFVHVRHGN